MSNREIEFHLKLRDEATKKWQQFQGEVHSGSNRMQKIFTGLKAIIAGAFAVRILKDFSQAAMENELALAKTQAVIKSTGGAAGMTAGDIRNLANRLTELSGVDDEVIQGAENVMLTFTSISKETFPRAMEAALNMSIALGQDLKGSVIQLGKALQDPILGVTALRRVGVNFNETSMKMIKNLVETGKVAEAQTFILKELETEFGGVAKAAGDTFAGELGKLKSAFTDAKEKLGYFQNSLLRELMPTLKWLSTDGLPAVMKWISALKVGFAALAFAILTPFAWLERALNVLGISSSKTIQQFQTAAWKLTEQYAKDASKSIAQIKREMNEFNEVGTVNSKVIADIAGATDNAWKTSKDYEDGIKKLKEGLQNLTIGSKEYAAQLILINEKQNQFKIQQEWSNAAARGQVEIMREMPVKISGADKAMEKYRKTVKNTNLEFLEIPKSLKKVIDASELAFEVEMQNHIYNAMDVLGVLQDSMVTGFQAAFSGAEASGKTFIKNLLTGFIDMIQGMIFAAEAAALAKAVPTWGTSLIADLPMLASATFMLQLAKAIVNRFHGGGVMGYGGERRPLQDDERPAILKVGETVRTKEQEARLGAGGNTFHFHFPGVVTNEEGVVTVIKRALEKSGFNSLTDLITNDRKGYSFGTV